MCLIDVNTAAPSCSDPGYDASVCSDLEECKGSTGVCVTKTASPECPKGFTPLNGPAQTPTWHQWLVCQKEENMCCKETILGRCEPKRIIGPNFRCEDLYGAFTLVPKDYCKQTDPSIDYELKGNVCVATKRSDIFLCLSEKYPEGCPTAIGNIKTDPGGFIQVFLKYALMLAGLALIASLIMVGYKVLTSQGNPEKLQGAKEMATSLFAGIILIVFSMVLLQAIGVDILNLPGLK